jgi:hypothetical protein
VEGDRIEMAGVKAMPPRNGVFRRESDMANTAIGWMRSRGLSVKSEFITPWGICDLAGVRFNAKKVAHRLRLGQTRAISSVLRALLLLAIPEAETHRSISVENLSHRFGLDIDTVSFELDHLISGRFVIRTSRGRFQKQNGWMPLHDRLVAVELKLSRVEEAMRQAVNNLAFADESYVGFPHEIAVRIAGKPERWANHFDEGIGLLSVSRGSCEVLISARKNTRWIQKALRLYSVEKFWRTRSKGS